MRFITSDPLASACIMPECQKWRRQEGWRAGGRCGYQKSDWVDFRLLRIRRGAISPPRFTGAISGATGKTFYYVSKHVDPSRRYVVCLEMYPQYFADGLISLLLPGRRGGDRRFIRLIDIDTLFVADQRIDLILRIARLGSIRRQEVVYIY